MSSIIPFMYGQLSALHPGSVYVFFHFYISHLRLVALALGAAPLFMPEPISIDEIIRAVSIFDAGTGRFYRPFGCT